MDAEWIGSNCKEIRIMGHFRIYFLRDIGALSCIRYCKSELYF